MTDRQILDWIEEHPQCEIVRVLKMPVCFWTIYDGPVSSSNTKRMARAGTLRETVIEAAQHPYECSGLYVLPKPVKTGVL